LIIIFDTSLAIQRFETVSWEQQKQAGDRFMAASLLVMMFILQVTCIFGCF